MDSRACICAVVVALLACSGLGSCDSLRVDLSFGPTTLASSPAALPALTATSRVAVARIAVDGFCSSASSGNPALPCKMIYLALPPNADMTTVTVSPSSYSTTTLPGSYDIGPVPAIASADATVEWGAGKSVIEGRNTLVYGRDDFYPREQVRVVQVGNLRSWKIAALEFWPYAYNPTTGQLRVLGKTEAAVSFRTRSGAMSAASDPLAAGMSGFLQNGEEAATWYGSAPDVAPRPGYAIITTSAIAFSSSALVDFVNLQSSRGFTPRIVTEAQWGGGTGNTAAENIRAWLKSSYLPLGLKYVLLIGNPNPASGDVPMKMLWPRRSSTSYRDAPSDYYYSDLTGNWDLDADGYAGEEPDDLRPGGIDRVPEVYVGRIPCYGNIAELDSILRKTISYESTAHGDWARTFLAAMKPMDSDTLSYQLGEQIVRDFVWAHGLTPDRIYDDTYGLSLPPEHYPCAYDTVQNEWTKGAGFVFWMTHGSSNTAGSVFSSSRCAYLDDTKPSMVYMASCSNGSPEDSGNLGYRVLVGGGVSTFSASRTSWYYLGETDYTHADSIGGLGYQYARFLLQSGESCGMASMDARLANPMGIWPNHLVYNLYGDPSLEYSTARPATGVAGVGALRQMADGAWARLDRAVLTRIGDGDECFVQDENRCAGIRVTGPGVAALQPGSEVSVTGCLATENGMRVLSQATATPTGASTAVSPLGMSARGIKNATSYGLLVLTWGRVLSDAGNSFTVPGINKKSSTLKITCHGSDAAPPVGTFVLITGISTPDGVAVYGAGDVVVAGY